MKKLTIVSGLLFIVSLMACSSLSVISDFDPEYDFSTFKTYRWALAKELNPNDELAKDPITQKRVMNAVDKELAAKDLTLVDDENVDFIIIAHAGIKERIQIDRTGSGGAYHGWYDPWWGPYGGSTHVSYYEEGTLVIDIVSWEKKELAWRGMGTGIIKEYKNQEKAQQDADNVVAQILAGFPPQ